MSSSPFMETLMPRTKNVFEEIKLRDTLSLASIAGALPMHMVRDALQATSKMSERIRTLSREFVIYLTIFLCIFREKSTGVVLEHLFEGLDALFEHKHVLRASEAAISKARAAMGEKPMRHLFRNYCKPICREDDEYAFYNGLRKCSIDASEFYLPCTEDILKSFPSSENDAKNPQNCAKIKFGATVEVGSHVIFDVEYGTVNNSEQDFADVLIGRLGTGNLLLGDRYYTSVLNILRVKEQGSEVLFRAAANLRLAPKKHLYDGTFLAKIKAGRRPESHASKFKENGKKYSSVVVRVIPFLIKSEKGEVVDSGRLITTLLDPAKCHASDLIRIYTERWEEESVFDELKTHLMRGAQDSLRSKTAELAKQEFWAMLIAHYAIRRIMYDASELAGEMPNRISFVGVRETIQRKTTSKPFSPSAN